MRYLYIMLFMLFSGTQVYSQNWEAGAFVGGANYIGDVGNTTYIKPSDLVFGGLLKWNRSTRHSYRLSLLYSEIEGIDRESNDTRRQQRGYSFTNSIMEVSAGIEFTYFDYDPHRPEPQATPYLYTGISYFQSDDLSLDQLPYQNPPLTDETMVKRGTNWAFAIPMVLGYKQTISSSLSAGIEIGARYTFTDNFDGSAPSDLDGAPPTSVGTVDGNAAQWNDMEFGNSNNNDWYVFTGIYLTFNWGRKPCYAHL